jgi:hypothetical protein
MKKVQRREITDFQSWVDARPSMLGGILEEKEKRRIHLGPELTFLFESTTTIRYQIQEMMRIEQIVREKDIQHEIDTYNAVLGDEGELGCTLLVEIESPKDRDLKLREWKDLPGYLYLALSGGQRVRAEWDARQVGEDRLSSVQYLKFRVGDGQPVGLGSDHPKLTLEVELTDEQKRVLREDATQ